MLNLGGFVSSDTNVDPSLQDRQKLLKKAKLQDNLNDRLAKRPGPLELVEGNILQTDPELKDAIIGMADRIPIVLP